MVLVGNNDTDTEGCVICNVFAAFECKGQDKEMFIMC